VPAKARVKGIGRELLGFVGGCALAIEAFEEEEGAVEAGEAKVDVEPVGNGLGGDVVEFSVGQGLGLAGEPELEGGEVEWV
jgi:hypothetical protein